jgi:DNA-binding transcriptional regulator YdaS (Cro superfamily)
MTADQLGVNTAPKILFKLFFCVKKDTMKTGLEKAVEAAGGLRALGRLLKVDHAVIIRWSDIPAHWIIKIEHATGVPREELRPDLYLAPRPTATQLAKIQDRTVTVFGKGR